MPLVLSGSNGISTNGTAHALVPDSTGRVRMPLQPAFEVTAPSSIGISSTFATIVFTSVLRNQGSHYSTSTGLCTAPVAGVYHFSFYALYYPSNEGTLVDLKWIKNGANIQDFQASAPAGLHFPRGISHSFFLNANDTLGIQHRGTGGNLYGTQNYFTGILIG